MKKATKQEMLDYLEEVATAYNKTNLSIKDDIFGAFQCFYYNPTSPGKGCAIGRRIKDKELCKKFDTTQQNVKSIMALLPLNLKKFHIDFLSALQRLHDNPLNWSKKGMSRKGSGFYKRIKKYITNNDYAS